MTYKQTRKDYERLCEIHGNNSPPDLTGAFVLDDSCWELLKNPTKSQARKIYEELISYGAYSGWGDEGSNMITDWKNAEVAEIMERHGECQPDWSVDND